MLEACLTLNARLERIDSGIKMIREDIQEYKDRIVGRENELLELLQFREEIVEALTLIKQTYPTVAIPQVA